MFDPRAESFSFSIENISTHKNLAHGPNMLRKIYTKVHPDHILTLAAQSSWIRTYDLTQLFKVPVEGEYSVSLANTLIALPDKAELPRYYRVGVESQAVKMRLAKSLPVLEPRIDLSDNGLIHTCNAAQQWAIHQTVQQATNMATNAKKAIPLSNPVVGYWPNEALYQEYFNNQSQQTVFNIFNKIS